MVSYWFFKAIALNKIVKKFKEDFKFKKAYKLILEINFFNAITPFSSGGQPFEIYSLRKLKIKMADCTTIVIQQFVVYINRSFTDCQISVNKAFYCISVTN